MKDVQYYVRDLFMAVTIYYRDTDFLIQNLKRLERSLNLVYFCLKYFTSTQ